MSSGLFAVICPKCAEELHIDERGTGTCTTCAHLYLYRVGYLIPVEVPIDVAPIDVALSDGEDDDQYLGEYLQQVAGPEGSVPNASMAMGGA